jgi:ABC-2 type transport system ATP-binding protein
MVSFQNISKSYGEVEAVKNISFTVEKNEIFGLIGPDGAGKSTLFQMLATVLLPDSGTMLFDGRDVVQDFRYIRLNIGYMPGKFSLYQDLSVMENLRFFATIFNTTIEENYDLIRDIYEQLVPFGNRRAGALSGGMKQKLALSCALIHKPKVLVLDEPTFGVDAVSRKEFWETLAELKRKGVTILVSTPYMDEAALCDRIALIQDGDILEINSPKGLIQSFNKTMRIIKPSDMHKALVFLRSRGFEQAYSFGQEIHIYLDSNEQLEQLESLTWQNHLGDVYEKTPGVEDCFMNLMIQKQTSDVS